MRRRFCVLCLVLLGFLLWVSREKVPPLAEAIAQGEMIRLHVIANSDSEADQRIKLLVRDALLEQFTPYLQAISLQEARQTIHTLLPALKQCAAQAALEAGFDGSVEVTFQQEAFPTRVYGDQVVPAGMYDALCVRLGEAQGRNWWCVMYPPLCLLSPDFPDVAQAAQPEIEEEEQPVVFESILVRWFRALFHCQQEDSTHA